MYDHLDRLSEDDEYAAQPVELCVFARLEDTGEDSVEIDIPGYPHLLVLPTKSATERLRSTLQSFVDCLRNSEAARFIKNNHTKGHKTKTHEVAVRVPRAIAEAIA